MRNAAELQAYDARITNNLREDYFRDLNSTRVKRWNKYFTGLQSTLNEFGTADDGRQQEYRGMSEMVLVASKLYEQQLTHFLTIDLPEWLAEQVKQQFPSRLGSLFALGLREISEDGFIGNDLPPERIISEAIGIATITEASQRDDVQSSDSSYRVRDRCPNPKRKTAKRPTSKRKGVPVN